MRVNKRLKHNFEHCLNCEKSLDPTDDFCGRCGQKRITGRISFRQLIYQFVEDTFNWDARLFRSLRGLFKPGFLTVEYFKGRHIPYWQPLRLFLFMAAVQMITVNISFNEVNEKVVRANDKMKQSVHEYLFLKHLDTLKSDVLPFFNNKKVAKAAMDSLLMASVYPERFTTTLKDKNKQNEKIDSFKTYIIAKIKAENMDSDSLDITQDIDDAVEDFVKKMEEGNRKNNFTASIMHRLDADNIEIPFVAVGETLKPHVDTTNGLSIGWNEKNLYKTPNKSLQVSKYDFLTLSPDSIINKYKVEGFWNQVLAKQTIKVMRDGKSGVDFFLGRLSWMIIIMMPIFALFLELVNRKQHYVEHVVFSFHCHALMFLIFSIWFFSKEFLLQHLPTVTDVVGSMLPIGLLFYFYKAMRKVYQQDRFLTIIKFGFLFFTYLFTLIFAIFITILASFFFF
jgi:Protein of unknown function (DUF3667)